MESKLCKVVMRGDCEGVNELLINDIEMVRGVAPHGNSCLHVAAAGGHQQMVQLLLTRMPCLLSILNFNHETPLHTAARSGNSEVVEALLNVDNLLQCNCSSPSCPRRIDLEGSPIDVQAIWRAQNNNGETALHYAAQAQSWGIVEQLLNKVEGIALIVNNEGESALYTACYYCCPKIVRRLLSEDPAVADTRNDGTSCLHQAIIHILELSLTRNLPLSRNFQWSERRNHRRWHDFALELAFRLVRERPKLANTVDPSGNSALHLLVALPMPDNSHLKLVKELLNARPDMNFQFNKETMAPIHIAARDGNVAVIRCLLDSAPHCCYLLGKDNKNALLFALEHDDGLPLLLNVECLLRDSVDEGFLLNQPDNQGKTALSMANTSLDGRLKLIITRKLRRKSPPQLDFKEEVAVHEANRDQSKEDINGQKAYESLSVVAALIATITFAAAFTVPGGLNQSNGTPTPNDGTPVFMHKAAFKTFILFDSLAFSLSIMSLYQLIYNPSLGLHTKFYRLNQNIFGRREVRKRVGTLTNYERRFAHWGIYPLFWSFRATLVAFATGMYVVVAPKCERLAVTVFIITFCGLLFERWLQLLLRPIPMIRRIFRNSGKRIGILRSFYYFLILS